MKSGLNSLNASQTLLIYRYPYGTSAYESAPEDIEQLMYKTLDEGTTPTHSC